MKKYLLPIAVLSFFVSIPYADACRVASSDVVADVRHTLLNDTSAIALAQPISSGASVSAKVIIGNKNRLLNKESLKLFLEYKIIVITIPW